MHYSVLLSGLFPAVLNLASMAEISSNATCGFNGPEMYCKLVEHVPGWPFRNPQCRVCDMNSQNPKERHPITNAIDGTNRWWQSPSIRNGMKYHDVIITLDLNQVFQIAYIIIKAANSPRPGNWILERSFDGITYKAWQYYAITDTECLTRYKIIPRRGTPSYTADDEVICTSFYSKIHPLENGEIHTSLITGRPSAEDPSSTLLNFTSARYIRLRLQRIRTLNADLMTLAHHDPKDVDAIVTRRYYYSLKDISIGGLCICYGHAKDCPVDLDSKKFSCECEHNTCGDSCDHCCPGFHQSPWQAGTFLSSNACEKCNCHGKTKDCYYDQNVADRNQSLNTNHKNIGGGVCTNCANRTTGINCETCIDEYFRPQRVSPYDSDPCVPCRCNSIGSLHSKCIKDDNLHCHLDLLPGSCRCKPGFGGVRCDRCAFGFTGFPNCFRCSCSAAGSSNTDPCIEPCICKASVEGENCDMCKKGFYNLQLKNPNGCDQCFCSGVSTYCENCPWTYDSVRNVFRMGIFLSKWANMSTKVHLAVCRNAFQLNSVSRSSCILPCVYLNRLRSVFLHVADSQSLGQDVATDVEICECPIGYSGTSCESCLPGFRRVNSTLYGGICEACKCHGHSVSCDDITGECLGCQHHTTGIYCDQCQPGFYGYPIQGTPNDCQLCSCPLLISTNNFSPTCHLDSRGEQICDQCAPGYSGPQCNRCTVGFFGHPTEPGGSCQPCQCNGNLDLSVPGCCDSMTGECLHCIEGTTGQFCELCAESFFGDAVAKSCQACQCHVNGSTTNACDTQTGQCQCKPNVEGRKCNHCMSGTYDLSSSRGCIPCNCNSFGSKSFDCDEKGQCRCQPGVTGPKCDRCGVGFYNFQEGGCISCDCAHIGNHCDPNTGQCICPPNTVGEKCNKCALNFWGHNLVSGCKPCNCTTVGSLNLQCDEETGCCFCHPEFTGDKCDRCRAGYWEYPLCRPCNCDLAGTKIQSCDEMGICTCEQNNGQCDCKVNVEGILCGRCKTGTFALRSNNPYGCNNCYCFGVTSHCTEASGLIYRRITLTHDQTTLEIVDKLNLHRTTSGVFYQHPEIVANVDRVITDLLYEPFYWKLSGQFEGEKLTAYGGKLRYTIYFEAREEVGRSTYEPQVIMRGGPTKDMAIIRHISAPQIGQLTRHEIEYYNSADGSPVSRKDFMDILYDIDCILIRMAPVFLVSQECARGYYRLPLTAIGGSNPMLWNCVACQCNSHSDICDSKTSICQNCQHNTAGDHCDVCARGYYGIVRGSPNDCRPCACPLQIPNNNFSPTCIVDEFTDYRCNACLEGYEGQYCDRCAPGYYGNPTIDGSSCVQCECDPLGSLPVPCDTVTGQCRCLPGMMGQTCDGCMDWHVRVGTKCISCDDECTGLLLNDLQHLNMMITSLNLSGPLPPPYHVLYKYENVTQELKASDYYKNNLEPLTRQLKNKINELTIDIHVENLPDLVHLSCSHILHVYIPLDQSKLEEETDRLLDKLKPIKNLQDTVGRNISHIKELINQARKHANSIKVSVASGGDCIRTYRPDIKKGTLNSIILNVRTSELENLLFYLGSAKFTDFLAIEMRKGKVNFLWDVGSGVGRVEYPDLIINDFYWYRIEASRFQRNGTISVRALEGPRGSIMPTIYHAVSPEGYTILDVDTNAYLFVGGLTEKVKKADAVKTTTFSGCMGETFLDGKPIGLWNYKDRQGECKGCVVRYGTVQFDGEGYAAVSRPSRWNPNVSAITFKFKTFSSDALLMYLATKDMKDFMSIELKNGQIKVSYDLGSGTANVTGIKHHNDGKWKVFTLSRIRKEGKLRMPIKNSVTTLDNISLRSALKYSGCLRDIEVSRTPYNLLSGTDYLGLTKGCTLENVHTVSFQKPGFIELKPQSLNVSTEISLSFSTKNETGMILYGSGARTSPRRKRRQSGQVMVTLGLHFHLLIIEFEIRTEAMFGLVFYIARINHADFATIQIKDGMPHFSYDLGSGNTSVVVRKKINDGEWHKRATVTVGLSMATTVSPKNADILDVVGLIYIGGLPKNYTTRRIGPVIYSINACIRNFKLNSKTLDMDNPESSLDVGTCFLNSQKGTYFDGTGFAKPVARYRVGMDLQIEFDFRTSQRNAVLLGISSQKVDAIGIELVNGKILVHVDNGAGRFTAVYDPERFNGLCNGQWHTVVVNKIKYRLELTVDGKKVESKSSSTTSTATDTNDPIFVGGYPDGVKQLGLTTNTGFKGCIRHLKLVKGTQTLKIDFSKAVEIKGVQPLTCPA
uniref:Basement membrane-specific heparan sulfate proteoglycan core protein n=1 Tax=Callorhinchus milii TaxID=7868 RepID=A0A4W3IED9_CALMI